MTNHIFILILFFLTAFSGLVFYLFDNKVLDKIKGPGLFFALGTLGGTIFFHLVPEYLETEGSRLIYFLLAIPGFCVWFLPALFRKRTDKKNTPSIIALMAGDALHNAFTSVIWMSLCLASGRVELLLVPAILIHEIPHKVGNFAIMIFSGISKQNALLLSILSSLFFFAGVFMLTSDMHFNGTYMIPFIIGTLCYTLVSGIWHERASLSKRSLWVWLAGGFFLMIFVGELSHLWHHH